MQQPINVIIITIKTIFMIITIIIIIVIIIILTMINFVLSCTPTSLLFLVAVFVIVLFLPFPLQAFSSSLSSLSYTSSSLLLLSSSLLWWSPRVSQLFIKREGFQYTSHKINFPLSKNVIKKGWVITITLIITIITNTFTIINIAVLFISNAFSRFCSRCSAQVTLKTLKTYALLQHFRSGRNKSFWSKSNDSLVQAERSQVGGETQQSCRSVIGFPRPDFGNILITNEQYFSLLIKILFLHFLLGSIPTVAKANPYFTRVSIIPENWLLASPCFLLVNWNLRSYSHETNFWGVICKKEE